MCDKLPLASARTRRIGSAGQGPQGLIYRQEILMKRRASRPLGAKRLAVAVAAIVALGAISAASAQAAIVGTTDANTLGSAISTPPPVSGAVLDTAPVQPGSDGQFANAVDN